MDTLGLVTGDSKAEAYFSFWEEKKKKAKEKIWWAAPSVKGKTTFPLNMCEFGIWLFKDVEEKSSHLELIIQLLKSPVNMLLRDI